MFKGTVKRVLKRLQNASNNRQRRLSDHHRLSDHRAVAHAVQLTVGGWLRNSRLTGSADRPNGEGAPARRVATPETLAAEMDKEVKKLALAEGEGHPFMVTARGKIAQFGRGWANA